LIKIQGDSRRKEWKLSNKIALFSALNLNETPESTDKNRTGTRLYKDFTLHFHGFM